MTAFDLDENSSWDIVPYAAANTEEVIAGRKLHMRSINNSWWYARQLLNKLAQMVYGTVYELSPELGTFDIVTLGNMLLHVRDPFLAIQRAAGVSKKYIAITELTKPFILWNQPPIQINSDQHFCQFLPSHKNQSPNETWWYLPAETLTEFLQILGFNKIQKNRFMATFKDGKKYEFYCLLGEKT